MPVQRAHDLPDILVLVNFVVGERQQCIDWRDHGCFLVFEKLLSLVLLRRDSNAAIQLIGQGLGFRARLTLAAGIAADDDPMTVVPAELEACGLRRNGDRSPIRGVLDRLPRHTTLVGEKGNWLRSLPASIVVHS